MDKKYTKLVNNLIDLIGGKENISYFTHCVTRLRFNVKDKGLVKEKELDDLEGVVGHQWAGEQLQIIVGTSVGEVYNAIAEKYGFEQDSSVNNNGGQEKKKKFSFMTLIDTIASCITPVLPVLIGGGMLRVILLICELIGVLTTESPTYVTLDFVSEAAFHFLPVFVGAASARRFGMNMWIGMFFGAVLISPTFSAMIEAGDAGSIFGLPIYGATYASSIFPIILTNYLASRIEKFITRVSPDFLKMMLVPLVTILITTPIMLLLLGPLGAFIGDYLTISILWVYDKIGFFAVALMGALMPWLVITGMHHSFNPYSFQSIATRGYEPLALVVTFINNLNQGAASMAVAIKSKNKDLKAVATTTGATALISGVTEPALYGVTLKYRTPLYAVMIGNVAGGIVAGLFQVVIYAFAGSWGIFGLPAFIGGEGLSNFIYMIIAVIVGIIVTFIATLILFKDNIEEEETINKF
ncbi:hypothetical protein GCM10025886_18260 [Tetragenococcus halophilus subsp. flandriensis]|uniref:PTS transporter subunit EIIC n=1 Tax=Tetragenococcus halophilus TaxID=51669 RepID=UPI0023E9A2D7|nr:PTS transporter subunit EIIC [Tetragenococcus halophilus]GMA08675.1 hypothetical protein GCM10025886_18260 [Tetragenococcus halophilus subsp. flandriensis]